MTPIICGAVLRHRPAHHHQATPTSTMLPPPSVCPTLSINVETDRRREPEAAPAGGELAHVARVSARNRDRSAPISSKRKIERVEREPGGAARPELRVHQRVSITFRSLVNIRRGHRRRWAHRILHGQLARRPRLSSATRAAALEPRGHSATPMRSEPCSGPRAPRSGPCHFVDELAAVAAAVSRCASECRSSVAWSRRVPRLSRRRTRA